MSGDILKLLGYGDDISNQEKADLYEKMANTIQNRVITRVLDRLTEEEANQFMAIDEGAAAALSKFLEDRNINVTQLLTQEALIFKSEVVSLKNYLNLPAKQE